MGKKKDSAAVVVDLPNKKVKESNKKWGAPVIERGFCIIPSLLFRAQARLGLSAQQLTILLQIIDHWWTQDSWPFPRKRTLSDRTGMSSRQIQRHIADLERAGYIKRVTRYGGHHGKKSNKYDLSGLVTKLKELEPEYRKADEAPKAVNKRGGLAVN